jgi:pyruvate/2-oxoglutarate/acetoin dehydrogenase E1 component
MIEGSQCYNLLTHTCSTATAGTSYFCCGAALQVEREGTDVTIVTFSKMVGHSLQAAEALKKEGVSVEVINLRTLRPLDYGTVLNSVKKTSRLVTVEEGWPQNGIGADISANVTEQVSTASATTTTLCMLLYYQEK